MKTPEQMAEEFSDFFKGERRKTIAKKSWYTGFEEGLKRISLQWISVKDRLPEMYEWVLIDGPEVCKRIEPPSSNWKEQYAWETNHDSFYSPNDVTHWMPLPEAPEEEK